MKNMVWFLTRMEWKHKKIKIKSLDLVTNEPSIFAQEIQYDQKMMMVALELFYFVHRVEREKSLSGI
jgi:hypothetical protein